MRSGVNSVREGRTAGRREAGMNCGNRQQREVVSEEQARLLREYYESVFDAENRPIATFEALIF